MFVAKTSGSTKCAALYSVYTYIKYIPIQNKTGSLFHYFRDYWEDVPFCTDFCILLETSTNNDNWLNLPIWLWRYAK